MFPWSSNARSYSQRVPVSFVRGTGAFLFDAQGADYLDFLTGAGASILGHAHPAVVDAIRNFDVGFFSHLDLVTDVERDFAEQLLPLLPFTSPDDIRLHFCAPTGSDAVEAALKLARIVTGRSSVWAFTGSYHGGTQGALSVTSSKRLRTLGLHGQHDVVFFPFPAPSVFPSPFASEEEALGLSTFLLNLALLDDHSGVGKPAAIIIEPVQGEGGVHVAPIRFMSFLRDFCNRNDIVLICDEIQSGFGRTGNWFACKYSQIEPDILCLSKGMGGGLPVALIAYREKLNTWPSGTHIGTFRGPSLSLVCGTAIIKAAQETKVLQNVNKVGPQLQRRLSILKNEFPIIRSIRGIGLFIGVEFFAERSDLPTQISKHLFENRIIAETVGRNNMTLKLLPPLNLNTKEVEEFCIRFERVLKTITYSCSRSR